MFLQTRFPLAPTHRVSNTVQIKTYYYVFAISTKALKLHWTLATEWKQNHDSSANLKGHLAAGPTVPMITSYTQRQVDAAPYSQQYKHGDGTNFAVDVSGPAQLSQMAANIQSAS